MDRIDILDMWGYDPILNTNGQQGFIQRRTGEVYNAVTMVVPEGTTPITPEQKEAEKQWKEAQERKQEEAKRKAEAAKRREEKELFKQLQREKHNPLGKFYFLPTTETFLGIAPEMVTRLIYLSTFIDLNSDRLLLTQRTAMQRKDLVDVLRTSRSTASRFWDAVSPLYIRETADGLTVNKHVFRRGKINNRDHLQLLKFYVDGVRALYTATDQNKYNRLGDLFKLLPFVNVEWNLLCFPEYAAEKDLEKIRLLTMAEFCELIGYDVSHLNDLVSSYRGITFDVEGRKELFCSMIYTGVHSTEAKICINPNILYSGSDPEKVKVLGALCRVNG